MKASADKQRTEPMTRSDHGFLSRRAWVAGATTVLAGSTVSTAAGTGQQRVCFLLHVKKDRLEEYKERHSKVWPEMLQALRETGWHNYSLFLRDDGLLIGYLETTDFEKARAGMAGREVNMKWQSQVAEFFEIPKGAHADEEMRPLPEIFHLE
jgi:L-rhamnose mutarotase